MSLCWLDIAEPGSSSLYERLQPKDRPPMPKFFFHFHDGARLATDEEGLEMPSAEEAYLQATAAARDMWPELLAARINPMLCAFEINDQKGARLFRLPFTELIENCRAPTASASRKMADELSYAIARAQEAKNALADEVGTARRQLAESRQLIETLGRLDRTRPRAGA